MLLAIDIGNTHTVIGVYKDEQLIADWRVTSSGTRTADETWLTIKNLCADVNISPVLITGVGISSVVPNLTDIFETIARKHIKIEPIVVGGHSDLGFKIHYEDVSAVGADRLCNSIAGYKKYGGPLIIIDFGTATTFDVVAENGDYLGGVIALGVESTAGELHRRAAKLPKIELRFPARVVGQDTVSSMQAGVMFGAVDAVEGIVRRIQAEMGHKAKVIATGGLSTTMAKYTPIIEACEPSLVLDGVRLIYERVKGNQ
jgi:type III pantothenate kinase